MEPMKPMQPMKPMEPFAQGAKKTDARWPHDLGSPSVTGSSNDLHYAYFADKDRLAVDDGKEVKVYDTRGLSISGFSSRDSKTLCFDTGEGVRELSSLKTV